MKIMIKRDQCQLLWNIERFYNLAKFHSNDSAPEYIDVDLLKWKEDLIWILRRQPACCAERCRDWWVWNMMGAVLGTQVCDQWPAFYQCCEVSTTLEQQDLGQSRTEQDQSVIRVRTLRSVGAESTLSGVEQYDYLTLTRKIYKLCDTVKTVTQDFSGVKKI